jgi:N-acetylglucosaminyldiphosphoundecaprenol N-acetyl-beta-D-mannosaminyltransferase
MNKTDILGVSFQVTTPEDALVLLEKWVEEPKNHIVVTPNPEGVMMARRHEAFANALQTADLSLADGTGVVLAAKLLKKPLKRRVRGTDITFALFDSLDAKGKEFTVYFLGSKPDDNDTLSVAEMAKNKMEARYPNLKVTGFHHGYFDSDSDTEATILDEINRLSPDILLVCMGMPRQELWAVQHRNVNARLTLCVGGTLDIMGGALRRAPVIFQKCGLEWLYRLLRQPHRAKRMLDLPRFVFAVLKAAMLKRS